MKHNYKQLGITRIKNDSAFAKLRKLLPVQEISQVSWHSISNVANCFFPLWGLLPSSSCSCHPTNSNFPYFCSIYISKTANFWPLVDLSRTKERQSFQQVSVIIITPAYMCNSYGIILIMKKKKEKLCVFECDKRSWMLVRYSPFLHHFSVIWRALTEKLLQNKKNMLINILVTILRPILLGICIYC